MTSRLKKKKPESYSAFSQLPQCSPSAHCFSAHCFSQQAFSQAFAHLQSSPQVSAQFSHSHLASQAFAHSQFSPQVSAQFSHSHLASHLVSQHSACSPSVCLVPLLLLQQHEQKQRAAIAMEMNNFFITL
jgi:hypothetical protein